jgi:hypothetical protein
MLVTQALPQEAAFLGQQDVGHSGVAAGSGVLSLSSLRHLRLGSFYDFF